MSDKPWPAKSLLKIEAGEPLCPATGSRVRLGRFFPAEPSINTRSPATTTIVSLVVHVLTAVSFSSNYCLTCIYQIKKEDRGGIVEIEEEEMNNSVENLQGSSRDIVQNKDMDEDSIVHVSSNEEEEALEPGGANGGEQEENPVVNKLISLVARCCRLASRWIRR